MFRFTLRDVFWFTLLVALLLVWWREGVNLDSEKRMLENEIRNAIGARDTALKELRTTDPYFVAEGWHTVAEPDEYELGVDGKVCHGGEYSAFIKAKSSSTESYALLYQTVHAEEHVGKRVRLSGYIKTKSAQPDPYSSPSFFIGSKPSVDGELHALCDQQLPTSADWRRYNLVLDIPPYTPFITFGVVAQAGATWIDDLQLEVVDDDFPVTPPSHSYLFSWDQPQLIKNRTFPSVPLSLDFEPLNRTHGHGSNPVKSK